MAVAGPNNSSSGPYIPYNFVVTQQSGASYTFQRQDGGNYILFTSGSAVTVTVPNNSSVSFPIGVQLTFEQNGAGQITVQGAGGVTVHSTPTLKSSAQYAVLVLVKVALNTWTLAGNLALT